jgi:ribosomal-protein-alanine N-acetyltransferase
MPLLRCQPLTLPYLDQVLALDRACLGGLWTVDGYRRELESPNSDLLIVLANSEMPPAQTPPHQTSPSQTLPSQVIGLGCLWAILEEAHITLLAVDPQFQGQGIGQWLLLQLMTASHQRGLERATLEVRASNQRAIYLYQKLGFKTAGRRRRYYADGEDALILWRSGLNYDSFPKLLHDHRQQLQTRLQSVGWDAQASTGRNAP